MRSACSRLLILCFLILPCLPVLAQPKPASHLQTILVMGDSLSAAYNLPVHTGWVSLLEKQLAKTHPHYRIINSSISGETSAGGRSRLPALLDEHQPGIVIIELGANDGLRGYPITAMADNLEFMIRESQLRQAEVLLIGMYIPPNYGPRYTRSFRETYTRLAHQYKTSLMPFLLEGIATNDTMMQADGLHPTAEAQPFILNNVLPYLTPLLKSHDHAPSQNQSQR